LEGTANPAAPIHRAGAHPHRGTEVHMSNITVDAIIGEPEVLEDEVTAAEI